MSSEGTWRMVWWIPVVLVVLVLLFVLLVRLTVGNSTVEVADYGTHPFVPAESPYSTGEQSR